MLYSGAALIGPLPSRKMQLVGCKSQIFFSNGKIYVVKTPFLV